MTTTATIVALLLVAGMAYAWYALIFKKKPDVDKPFPRKWRRILRKRVKFYKNLDDSERRRFEQAIQNFLHDVRVTGVETTVKTVDKLYVAASAVIPIFGFPNWRYTNIDEVLLYKGNFNLDYQTEGEKRNVLGIVGNRELSRMMILSKPALRQGFKNKSSKKNVGIHEFVHLLDKTDGATDGVPEHFLDQEYIIPWVNLMQEKIAEIKAGDNNINPYGATNRAEFFSVVSEYFFTRPHLLESKHPELYKLLEEIFNQELVESE